MSKYVLCKVDPQFGVEMFVCGHPRMPSFDRDSGRAAKFESAEEALAFRSRMDHQIGGTDKYRVHELLPDGRIIDVEP
jgi:hypothetical protein